MNSTTIKTTIKTLTDNKNHLYANFEMENYPLACIYFSFDADHLDKITLESLTNLHKKMIETHNLDPEIKMIHVFENNNDPKKNKKVYDVLSKYCTCNFEVSDTTGDIISTDEVDTAIFSPLSS